VPHQTRLNRIAGLSLSLSLLIVFTMTALPHFGTDLLAQTPKSNVNEQELFCVVNIYPVDTCNL
jgi:hypothetical protein